MTVTPAADLCVGNLATPVNSGYFIKGLINNLPLYRPGILEFPRLETGSLWLPGFRPLHPGFTRATEYQQTAGLLAAIGAVHILSLLFLLYNQPGKQPNIPFGRTVENPPADLFTRTGWADFTSGFGLAVAVARVRLALCNTVHVQDLFKIAAGVWSVG